jgi:transcriptional regulator with XRE-family HTH domain
MAHQGTTDAELAEIFGEKSEPIEVDQDELAVTLTLRDIRGQIIDAAREDAVGINQLARRLNVAPSSVSRALSDGGDMRVSTAVLYGRALGRSWDFRLRKDACHIAKCHDRANVRIVNQDEIERPQTTAMPVSYLVTQTRWPASGLSLVAPTAVAR